jgi:hypothetical protein
MVEDCDDPLSYGKDLIILDGELLISNDPKTRYDIGWKKIDAKLRRFAHCQDKLTGNDADLIEQEFIPLTVDILDAVSHFLVFSILDTRSDTPSMIGQPSGIALSSSGDRIKADANVPREIQNKIEECEILLHKLLRSDGWNRTIAPPPIEISPSRFNRQGDYWQIEFKGDRFMLKDQKGLGYIKQLLLNPGREINVLELIQTVEPQASGEAIERVLPVEILDRTAMENYKKRLKEIAGERSKAEQQGDLSAQERLNEETESINRQLAGASGLGGRRRTFATDSERARVKVTKQINNARKKISKVNSRLGSHLKVSINTGNKCSYIPDPEILWEI